MLFSRRTPRDNPGLNVFMRHDGARFDGAGYIFADLLGFVLIAVALGAAAALMFA